MRLICLLVAVAVPFICCPDPLTAPNSSFEVDANADGVPDDWSLLGSTDLGECEVDTTQFRDGTASVRLTGTSPDARMWIEAPRIEVTPGDVCVFECWIKSEDVANGNPVVGVARRKKDGSWDNWSHVIRAPVNRDWQLCQSAFTVPETTSFISPRIWIERFEGTAWFDGLKITRYEPATPGYVDDMRQPATWQTSGGQIRLTEAGAELVSVVRAEGDTIFPVASMRRSLPEEARDHPVLRVSIGDVTGLWAMKVRDRGYVQQSRRLGGTYYYDLRKLEGARGGPARFVEVQALGDLAEVTVREIAFLNEAPPTVMAETHYTDHYVRDSGPLDGLKLDQEHPYIALSKIEIENAKSHGEAYEKWLAGMVSNADRILQREYRAPEEGYIYNLNYNCPVHGVPLTWRADHPHEHLCPVDRHIVTGPLYDREWRIRAVREGHSACRSALRGLGYAYALTGDEKYAREARDIFLDYADKFPNYLWHTGRGQLTEEGNGMRVAYEPLGEAGWLADIARSYDLVASSPAFTEAERQVIEDMLREDVRVSLRYDERLSNRQCHHNLAVAAVGLCLKDETLIRRAVGSLRHQLKYAILGDGFWWECSPGYHFYAVNTIMDLIQMLGRSGLDVAKDPKFKLAYDGPLHFLFPDGTLPGVNDSHWRSRPPLRRFEYLYSVFGDPTYVGLLDTDGRDRSTEFLLHGKHLGETAPLPSKSHLFFKAGMAMLKPSSEGDALCVAFDWGQTVAGHGHADKLNIVVHGNGVLLGLDNGSRSYFSPVWRFWDRQTLSHNTVVVNERSQLHRKGRLELFDHQPGLAVCQATADETYPGLCQRRTLFVTNDYAVDVFRLAADSTESALRDEPVRSIPHWRRETWGDSSPGSLARDFAQLSRSTQAHSGKFSAMIGRTAETYAGWSTNLRETTGPNCSWRSGVMPIQGGRKYEFTAWVKTQDATGDSKVELQWLGGNGRALARHAEDVPEGANDWRKISREVSSPAGAKFVGLRLGSSDNAGFVWFDDITLTPTDGDTANALTRNCDFETTGPHVETIDWTYHNLGELTCDVPLQPAEFTMGKDVEEPDIDGENGYRYMQDIKAGEPRSKNWRATWIADAATGRGMTLHVVGEPGTQVITADGQGPGTMRAPLVIARRRKADTIFGAVLEPTRRGSHVRAISRIPCTIGGREASCLEGYGIEVETADRVDYFLVSYTDQEKQFGPITLTPGEGNLNCVAMLSVTGNRANVMYVLGGEQVAWGKWSLRGPGAFPGEVISQDESEGSFRTNALLPPGVSLRDAPIIFDRPYNVSLSVASVSPQTDQSVIRLQGIPNLSLSSGMPFSIPAPMFVSRRAEHILLGAAAGGVHMTIPNGDTIRTIEYEDPEGRLRPVKFERADGRFLLSLSPAMLEDGRTYLVFNRPEGATLHDREPPRITRVRVNGKAIKAGKRVVIPWPADQVGVDFQDGESNLLAQRAWIEVNHRPVASCDSMAVRTVAAGRSARITVRATGDDLIQHLRIAIADDTLLGNSATFTLATVRAVEVIEMKGASGGKAVRTLDAAGWLETMLSLDPGEYTANLVATGPSLGTNSMWLDIDERRVDDPFHLPVGELGSCSREVDMTDKLPRFTIDRPGRHTLKFTLREGPGPLLDKLQILKAGKVIKQVECENMLP